VEKYLGGIAPDMPRVEAAFFGGNFTGLPPSEQEAYLQALGPFVKSGCIHGIRVSTRPDFIDMDIVERLARYGVDTVELGVQSLSDEVLSRARREHSTEDVYRAVDILRASGMAIILQLMAGLPGDSRGLSVASAREAAALKPAGMRIFPAVVLRGTELERMYLSGEYIPLTLDEAVDTCADMLSIFQEKNIQVIRMGLHPLKDGSGDAVAGPYHPAFGFLVKARTRRREMESAFRESIDSAGVCAGEAVIIIPRKNAEEYIGHKRGNISYLREKFDPVRIGFYIDDVPGIIIRLT
jgi:histone acetyltransferase (RNA polymerase elongator complex component)